MTSPSRFRQLAQRHGGGGYAPAIAHGPGGRQPRPGLERGTAAIGDRLVN
ncbi:MAG: hypothetical protein AVDCRST_MAG77-3955 [uncultured Chloroflexi bacterium]|uniref:Uncharacterized protein n=1 Tax=uncultured Chloroflexota bacterium TaxID=166587 RepID=A0A6J4JMB3_9CHLR|nr:MAG: hypothetical protein AVDCRST_MAG77-3955 [uncultured Chloroflexota bacterium]